MMLLGFLFGGSQVAHFAHLGGALFGLAYVKLNWRPFSTGNWLAKLKYRRQTARLQKNRQRAEDAMKQVDAVLDRINQVGFENLTRAERNLLEEASAKLAGKKADK
jgi:hypothetical protein